jgi:hypothetical protein
MLLSRNNKKGIINAAIKKGHEIDRTEVLKKQNNKVICALTFNPKLAASQI